MKVFDFNVHLPTVVHPDVNEVIKSDLELNIKSLSDGLKSHEHKLNGSIGANFLLFNTRIFDSGNIEAFKKNLSTKFQVWSLTALIDFRHRDLLSYLDRAKSQGVRMLMVNSYIQQISELDFISVSKIFKYAEENNMVICIDGSYGTSKMYSYDNMKLACFAADCVETTPIVIIHSGGLRVKEAMLLALDKSNVYLDTSFSLPFYLGSSLESDFAFVYKKIGSERVLYGSDIPYLNSDIAMDVHLKFLHKHGFTTYEIDNIMCNTALELVNG